MEQAMAFAADREKEERDKYRAAILEQVRSRALAKSAAPITPQEALSLLRQVRWMSDAPYAFAIGASALKDILDLVGIGSLPAIGTALSICVSIFIFMMMLLAGASSKSRMTKGFVQRALVLGGGTTVEAFMFGLNFVPVQTLTALGVYLITLKECTAQNGADEEA